jgi:hypothetical protein
MSARIQHPADLDAIKCSSRGEWEEIVTIPTRKLILLVADARGFISSTETILKIKHAGRPVEDPAPHRTAGPEKFLSTPVGKIKKITPQTHRPTGFLQTDSLHILLPWALLMTNDQGHRHKVLVI